MPRTSAAELSIVRPPTFSPPPKPPAELKAAEAEIWVLITTSMPRDWFKPESFQLLVQYCRHSVRARAIADLIHKADPRRDLDRFEQLLRMAEKETRAINALSRAMRLTHQSKYDPISAARRVRDPDARREKWAGVA